MRPIDIRERYSKIRKQLYRNGSPLYHQVYDVQRMVDNRIYWARFMTERRVRGIMVTFARR
jgi:hypothetical protein